MLSTKQQSEESASSVDNNEVGTITDFDGGWGRATAAEIEPVTPAPPSPSSPVLRQPLRTKPRRFARPGTPYRVSSVPPPTPPVAVVTTEGMDIEAFGRWEGELILPHHVTARAGASGEKGRRVKKIKPPRSEAVPDSPSMSRVVTAAVHRSAASSRFPSTPPRSRARERCSRRKGLTSRRDTPGSKQNTGREQTRRNIRLSCDRMRALSKQQKGAESGSTIPAEVPWIWDEKNIDRRRSPSSRRSVQLTGNFFLSPSECDILPPASDRSFFSSSSFSSSSSFLSAPLSIMTRQQQSFDSTVPYNIDDEVLDGRHSDRVSLLSKRENSMLRRAQLRAAVAVARALPRSNSGRRRHRGREERTGEVYPSSFNAGREPRWYWQTAAGPWPYLPGDEAAEAAAMAAFCENEEAKCTDDPDGFGGLVSSMAVRDADIPEGVEDKKNMTRDSRTIFDSFHSNSEDGTGQSRAMTSAARVSPLLITDSRGRDTNRCPSLGVPLSGVTEQERSPVGVMTHKESTGFASVTQYWWKHVLSWFGTTNTEEAEDNNGKVVGDSKHPLRTPFSHFFDCNSLVVKCVCVTEDATRREDGIEEAGYEEKDISRHRSESLTSSFDTPFSTNRGCRPSLTLSEDASVSVNTNVAATDDEEGHRHGEERQPKTLIAREPIEQEEIRSPDPGSFYSFSSPFFTSSQFDSSPARSEGSREHYLPPCS